MLYATVQNFGPSVRGILRMLKNNFHMHRNFAPAEQIYPPAVATLLETMHPETAQMSFREIFEKLTFRPVSRLAERDYRMDYWLSRPMPVRNLRPLILTSCDDYAVNLTDWYSMPLDLSKRADILTDAGHNGFFNREWFPGWIEIALSSPAP